MDMSEEEKCRIILRQVPPDVFFVDFGHTGKTGLKKDRVFACHKICG
jgi:hypothetical protein